MAIDKKKNQTISITLDKRVVKLLDGTIDHLNKNDETIGKTKITRSSFIQVILVDFFHIEKEVEKSTGGNKDA